MLRNVKLHVLWRYIAVPNLQALLSQKTLPEGLEGLKQPFDIRPLLLPCWIYHPAYRAEIATCLMNLTCLVCT